MASVSYVGRIQLVEIRTQATKQQHSCYTHTMLGRNLNNDVFIIDIYVWCLTSTSDVSQNSQRVTVVTVRFYNFVLRTRFTPIFYSLSSQPSADRHATDLHVTNSWPKAPA